MITYSMPEIIFSYSSPCGTWARLAAFCSSSWDFARAAIFCRVECEDMKSDECKECSVPRNNSIAKVNSSQLQPLILLVRDRSQEQDWLAVESFARQEAEVPVWATPRERGGDGVAGQRVSFRIQLGLAQTRGTPASSTSRLVVSA